QCAFFPGTLSQVRTHSSHIEEDKEGLRELEEERKLREQALNHAKHEALATINHAKHEVHSTVETTKAEIKDKLGRPSVLAGALTLGIILGRRGGPRSAASGAPQPVSAGLMDYALRPIISQLAMFAIAAATQWLETRRRARARFEP